MPISMQTLLCVSSLEVSCADVVAKRGVRKEVFSVEKKEGLLLSCSRLQMTVVTAILVGENVCS